jgi:hypothetical protein
MAARRLLARALLGALPLLALCACRLPGALGQPAVQFLPAGLTPEAGGVTARLVYRMNGLADAWADPALRTVVLASAWARGVRARRPCHRGSVAAACAWRINRSAAAVAVPAPF